MKLAPDFLVVAMLALAALPARAQPTLPPELAQKFSATLMPGTTHEAFLALRRLEFRQADADGDGAVSPADQVRAQEIAGAAQRAVRLAMLLRADLDGDGVVSREELVDALAGLGGRGTAQVDEIMRFDSNHDGKLDWQEMMAYARAAPNPAPRFTNPPAFDAIMALDAAHEGRVTWTTYQAAAERFFQSVDTDHDGAISRDEIEANRQRTGYGPPPELLRPFVPPEPKLACTFPPAPQGAKIVLFAGQQGQGISSVAIGSQDETTRAATATPGSTSG